MVRLIASLASKGWKGLHCGELDLNPVDRAAVGFNDSAFPSWGAGIVTARSTASASGGRGGGGKGGWDYHMFVSETTHGCGINSWFTNSEVSHAVADSPHGPYRRTGTVFPPFSTNPTLAQGGPAGLLVMAVAMGTANGSAKHPASLQCNCTDGSTPPKVRSLKMQRSSLNISAVTPQSAGLNPSGVTVTTIAAAFL